MLLRNCKEHKWTRLHVQSDNICNFLKNASSILLKSFLELVNKRCGCLAEIKNIPSLKNKKKYSDGSTCPRNQLIFQDTEMHVTYRITCALYIHLLVLLHQKHSLCNMVCKFSCSNNIKATNSIVHWCYFTMILDVASGLLATYFIYIRESNQTDCFH